MPSASITLDNVSEYLALPDVVAGGVLWLAPPDLQSRADWKAITQNSEKLAERFGARALTATSRVTWSQARVRLPAVLLWQVVTGMPQSLLAEERGLAASPIPSDKAHSRHQRSPSGRRSIGCQRPRIEARRP
ncbi:hypothetical protein D1224_10385 [Henriciella barbarensis]|uniref:Uncharacterized protein n=1 Tax=Henriciella barbarensis TaxID=86342 RepID=A0A399R420_9PROT|nr:hypothetical protein D1224_10385 [Henriciella barbarensis]